MLEIRFTTIVEKICSQVFYSRLTCLWGVTEINYLQPELNHFSRGRVHTNL